MWSPGFCAESVQGNHNQAGLVFVVVVRATLYIVSIGAVWLAPRQSRPVHMLRYVPNTHLWVRKNCVWRTGMGISEEDI